MLNQSTDQPVNRSFIVTLPELQSWEREQRLNLINAVSGVKPANLIATVSPEGISNAAIFSSVVHLGSNPALMGFVLRPQPPEGGDTYRNIRSTGVYTINSVGVDFYRKAHQTSAKWERGVSEFAACGLTESYTPGFAAPYVEESALSIGLQYEEELPIERNGTRLVVGSVQWVRLPDGALDAQGRPDLEALQIAGCGGLDAYYALSLLGRLPRV